MPYAILRFQKCKAGSVAACERHNERKKEAYKSNPNIDMERFRENYHLVAPPRYTHKKEINRMTAAAGCRVRRDSVMLVETLITASPEFMNSLPPAEQRAYFAAALDFVAGRVGKQNIISAVRDFANLDANGYGMLTGVKKFSQAEFDEHTQREEQSWIRSIRFGQKSVAMGNGVFHQLYGWARRVLRFGGIRAVFCRISSNRAQEPQSATI